MSFEQRLANLGISPELPEGEIAVRLKMTCEIICRSIAFDFLSGNGRVGKVTGNLHLRGGLSDSFRALSLALLCGFALVMDFCWVGVASGVGHLERT
jgi:hypothetical protein